MTLSNRRTPSARTLIKRNEQKETITEDILTSLQRQAVEKLTELVNTKGLYNLVGKSGVGKTFLAWYLVKVHSNWDYYAWLPVEEKVDSSIIIVDNVRATRVGSRRAREIRTFTLADSVIVISRNPVPEVTDRVHINK